MKKGIKANLYLPIECLDIICDREEEIVKYLNDNFTISYNIYEGEFKKETVCGIVVEIFNKTFSLVDTDYVSFKKYIKGVTGKQPKQIMKMKFDRI